MPTQCNTKPLEFEPYGRRRVVADFDGGPITSDAGALLLRRVDRRLSLSDQEVCCFTDHRDPRRVRHPLRQLISQRIVSHLRFDMSRISTTTCKDVIHSALCRFYIPTHIDGRYTPWLINRINRHGFRSEPG